MDGQGCAAVDADNARGARNDASRTNPAVQGNTVNHSLLMGALVEAVQRAEGPVNAAGNGTAIVMTGGFAEMASGAVAGGEVGALGLGLLSSRARNIQAVENAISNHLTMRDLMGAAKETVGFVIRRGSKAYDHRRELIETAANLRKRVQALRGSLNDPSHGAATREVVQQAIQRAETGAPPDRRSTAPVMRSIMHDWGRIREGLSSVDLDKVREAVVAAGKVEKGELPEDKTDALLRLFGHPDPMYELKPCEPSVCIGACREQREQSPR